MLIDLCFFNIIFFSMSKIVCNFALETTETKSKKSLQSKKVKNMNELRIGIDVTVGFSENTETFLTKLFESTFAKTSAPATTVELPAPQEPATKEIHRGRKTKEDKAPVKEEPKVEEKQPEAPAKEEPKAEEKQPEAPAKEEPKVEEKQPEAPAKEEPKAEEKQPEATAESKVTLEGLREILGKKIHEFGIPMKTKIKEKMTELGTSNLTNLDPSKYDEMYDFIVNATIEEGE